MAIFSVDCLDRTNTAQFVIGKVALAHQLHALGYIPGNHYALWIFKMWGLGQKRFYVKSILAKFGSQKLSLKFRLFKCTKNPQNQNS